MIHFILFFIYNSWVLHCKKYKLKNQNVFKYLSGYNKEHKNTRIQWRRQRQLILALQLQDRLVSTLERFVRL